LQTRYVTLDDRTQQPAKPLHFDALVTYLQSRACHSGFAPRERMRGRLEHLRVAALC
jgi:hypothetical protein